MRLDVPSNTPSASAPAGRSRLLATVLGWGAAALMAAAPQVQAAPKYADCGMRLMQQDNGTWVVWGRTTGANGGVASLNTTSFPQGNYLQGLTDAGLVSTRRLKSLDSLFATTANPSLKATNIFCTYTQTAFATLNDGTVVGWGVNTSGQIGNGDQVNKTVPIVVNLSGNITNIVGGVGHTVALLSNGTVSAWGANNYGQAGDGTTIATRPFPSPISGLTGVTAIASGDYFTLALLADGTVRAWGRNESGQMGDGTTTNRTTPVTVSGMTGVIAIAASASSSVALKSDGTVWMWGDYRLRGDGGCCTDRLTPVRVGTLANITAITTNSSYTGYALDSAGRVWGWGSNGASNTLLGSLAQSCSSACVPTVLSDLPATATQIFASYNAGYMRAADGKMFGWGTDADQQLAQGAVSSRLNWYATNPMRQAVTPSDFDLDYSSDILFRNTSTGDVWLWTMRDSGIAQSAAIGNVGTAWQIVGMGDADGDGKTDIFWRNSVTGENSVWFMDARQFKGTIPMETVTDQNWKMAAIADVNGDGRADIIWRNEASGLFSIWLIGPSGVTATRAYGGVPSNWEVKGAGDFDGDGKADIIWRDRTTGAVAIYRMDGTLISGTSFLAGGLSEWNIVGVTDIDRDGRAEILFRFNTGAVLAKVDLNTTGTAFATTTYLTAAGGDWNIAAIGDFDGDTQTDFLWRNGAGELVIWRMVNLSFPSAGDVRSLGNPGNVWQVIKP